MPIKIKLSENLRIQKNFPQKIHETKEHLQIRYCRAYIQYWNEEKQIFVYGWGLEDIKRFNTPDEALQWAQQNVDPTNQISVYCVMSNIPDNPKAGYRASAVQQVWIFKGGDPDPYFAEFESDIRFQASPYNTQYKWAPIEGTERKNMEQGFPYPNMRMTNDLT